MTPGWTAISAVVIGLLITACIPLLVYSTGQMHHQRCDAMGFKTGTLENRECVKIISRVPTEYQKELLNFIRGEE